MFPLRFLEVAAKSFVFPRCSNFIFPAPISYLGERYLPVVSIYTSSLHNDRQSMDVPRGHDLSRCDRRGYTGTYFRDYTTNF